MVECPYCEKYQDVCQDDGFGTDEDVLYEMTCAYCQKTFVFRVSWTPDFYSKKADCLNGSPHDYVRHKDYFGEYPDRKKCKDCGKVIDGRKEVG